MKSEDEKEKQITLEDLVTQMVEKATARVRANYEKAISELEARSRKTIGEVEDKLRSILAQMQSYVCYNCQKDLISGKDAIYTNFSGHKFCSHECIDEKANETK